MSEALDATKGRLFTALKDLSYVLLKAGVQPRSFVELAKMAYVSSATDLYGESGQRASMAEVARKTGLTRAEVKRMRTITESMPEKFCEFEMGVEADVLQAWHNERQFLDEDGEPVALLEKPGPNSFATLVEYCGGKDPVSMLKKLIQSKHVRKVGDLVTPLRRDHLIPDKAEGLPELLEVTLVPLCGTVRANFERDTEQGMVQQTAHCRSIGKDDLAGLRKKIRVKAERVTEEVDDLLSSMSNKDGNDNDDNKSVGFGVFYFEYPKPR